MNYNASLDDIIKQNKSKIGLKSRNRNWKNKNAKPAAAAARSNIKKKQNPPVFKAKLKKRRMIDVPDARMKIIQNKKKLRRTSVENMKSPLLKDARLKIEARRQKTKTPPPRSNSIRRGAAVTSLSPNGILLRRINPNLSKDNGIRVEYEDDDRSLENEPIHSRVDWNEQFTIRRTISNALERKRFPPTLMGYRDLDAEPEESELYFERDGLPFNELTRTITNVKASPPLRRNYSSRLSSPIRQRRSPIRHQRSSPIRQLRSPIRQRASPIRQRMSPMRQGSDDDMRDAPPPKSQFLSRESNYSSRESNFLSRDSNFSSRGSNFSSRDSNHSSREPNYSSRDSNYAPRESNSYRIMISNLHENVTSEDIKELFEDVGELVDAKMIRSGTAEVAYKHVEHAKEAVEVYHNRQLDGLPMKCMLISNPTESSSLKKRHSRLPPVSTKSSIEPDTHLIKKALFN